MANTLLTISMITNDSLAVLMNELSFTRGVNRQYDSSFGVSGAKIGDTLNVRKPPRFVGTTGPNLSVEDITETSVPLTLTTQFHVDFQVSSFDLTLKIDDFRERYIRPAVATIANKIDRDGLLLATNATYNTVGTVGTPLSSTSVLQAGAQLDINATPKGSGLRSLVVDPFSQVDAVDSLKTLFNDQQKLADQYRSGNMGAAMGFQWNMDQNVINHLVGPLGGTPLVNGASQAGNSLVTDGWTAAAASRLLVGDVFTIPNVFSVNPQSRQSTGKLQYFTVTANFSSDGTGAGAISISPAIVPTGAFQNVTASPADNAALTVIGAANTSYVTNLAFHRDAFTLATADLPLPGGTDMAFRAADKQTGVSIRGVRQYNIQTDQFPLRLDVLYGWQALYPEWSTRVIR